MTSLLTGNFIAFLAALIFAAAIGLLYKKCGGENPVKLLFMRKKFAGIIVAFLFALPIFLNLCGSLAAF